MTGKISEGMELAQYCWIELTGKSRVIQMLLALVWDCIRDTTTRRRYMESEAIFPMAGASPIGTVILGRANKWCLMTISSFI
jgi:hypothetical protein